MAVSPGLTLEYLKCRVSVVCKCLVVLVTWCLVSVYRVRVQESSNFGDQVSGVYRVSVQGIESVSKV